MVNMTAMIALGMQAMRVRLQQQEAENARLQATAKDASKVGFCTMKQSCCSVADHMPAGLRSILLSFYF